MLNPLVFDIYLPIKRKNYFRRITNWTENIAYTTCDWDHANVPENLGIANFKERK